MNRRLLGTVLIALAADSASLAQTAPETELKTSISTTINRGFSFTIKPAAQMPEGFPAERSALAGALIRGEAEDGVIHATDGTYEIYRKDGIVVVKTEKGGWLPYAQFSSAMRLEVKQAFDPDDNRFWARGNVTKGREALAKLIQLDHLVHRADIKRLTRVGQAFTELKRAGRKDIDGHSTDLHEGDLTDMTAFNVLQGPFEELVSRGTLGFTNVSGVGRVYLQAGVVRRVHVKAAGKYAYYNDEDNVLRRGMCSLELLADITKVGETKLDIPAEARKLLDDTEK